MTESNRASTEQLNGNRQWYDTVADDFVRRYEGFEGEYFSLFEEDIFARLSGTDGPVLDLGCGHGRFVSHVATEGKRLAVGVDLSYAMLRHGDSSLALLQANAAQLCFQDGSFAVVICMGLFEYMEDPGIFLKEINRILKPGGRLVFTFHQSRIASPVVLEVKDMPYFGRTVGERELLWRRVVRQLSRIEADLCAAGFETMSVRRIFLRSSRFLFRLGVGVRQYVPFFGNGLVVIAMALERLLGVVCSRGSDGNTILCARKS